MKRVILLAMVVVLLATFAAGCGEKGEAISWSNLILGEHLPEIESATGDVHNNTDKGLWFGVYDITAEQFGEYVKTCKAFGYTVDAEQSSSGFNGFNEAGYKISLWYMESQKELSVSLDAPMEMAEITWPSSDIAMSIPLPESTKGKIQEDASDYFSVYIGNMSKEAFAQYVDSCIESGFDVDYSRYDTSFYAKNQEGISLTVRYEGANVIYICVEPEDEEETEPEETEAEKEETKPEQTEEPTEAKTDELRADFKAAMDSYEEYMDEYVDFMKKYQKNPSDLTLLAQYAEMMSKYAELTENFEKWESEDMNDAELAYYLEVQERVTKKLLEIAQ